MKLDRLQSLPDRLKSNAVVSNIAARQRLFRQGDRSTNLFIIQQGRFKNIRHINNNKIATIQLLSCGESLGETSLFFDTYLSTAIAQVDSEVIAYPKGILLSAISEHPELLKDVLKLLCDRIHDLQLRLEWRDIKLSQHRILQYLKHQAFVNNSQIVNFDFPLQEIASELGFVPETLSRALVKLEREERIERQQNRIILQDFSVT